MRTTAQKLVHVKSGETESRSGTYFCCPFHKVEH